MPGAARFEIRGNRSTRTTIDARQVELACAANVESLPGEPIAFATPATLLARKLPGFDGSVAWHPIGCARQLEMRGQIVRCERPGRHPKAGQAR